MKKSANMSSVGQYSIVMTPLVRRSVSQKYPMSICLVCSAAGRPLSINLIVLWLSW